MRLSRALLYLSLTLLTSRAADDADFANVPKEKHDYQVGEKLDGLEVVQLSMVRPSE